MIGSVRAWFDVYLNEERDAYVTDGRWTHEGRVWTTRLASRRAKRFDLMLWERDFRTCDDTRFVGIQWRPRHVGRIGERIYRRGVVLRIRLPKLRYIRDCDLIELLLPRVNLLLLLREGS